MNRSRRGPLSAKPFVAGGVYDPQQQQSPVVASPQPQVRNYSYQNAVAKKAPQTPVQVPAPIVQPVVKEDIEIVESQEEENVTNLDESVEDVDMSEDPERKGKVLFKKIFPTRKKSSVRTKEKKIRQNRQLRKVILPKNALMALNEVKGITIGDFIINSNVGGGFTAVVTVNDNQYEGKGTSKVLAKNSACEKALRDFVIIKMRQKPRRISRSSSALGEGMDTSDANGENGVDSDGGESQKQDELDDVPMINLASFALYKLFSEWESEGFEIPEFHPAAPALTPSGKESDTGAVKEPKKPPIRTELPLNWETLHPATLLCMMRPGLNYIDLGVSGEKPNTIQTVGVVVDNNQFEGKGRSKKIARRNAAVVVCNTLFGTNFVEEEITNAVAS